MSWNPVWEDVFKSRPWGQYPGEDVVRFVAQNFYHVLDRSRVRILEVGSGTGANLWFMAREGFCVHGIDGAQAGVRIANERMDLECSGWRDRGGRIAVGDFSCLKYPDGYFDAVLDVVAVCYSNYELARGTYAELARVTRPGGRLFIRTFAQGCWGDGTGEAVGRKLWMCNEGPLKNLGATRFTSAQEVADLLPGWHVDAIGHTTISDDEGGCELRYLVIKATRAA